MIADVCCYAREKLNLDMVCVSHGPKDALARRKGGIGFATLQLPAPRRGPSVIAVVQRRRFSLAEGGVERHALAFLSDFKQSNKGKPAAPLKISWPRPSCHL